MSDHIIFSLYDLQVTQILLIKFQVDWHFGSGEEVSVFKIGFQVGGHDRHFEYSIERILVISDLQLNLILPTKSIFQLNRPLGSKVQYRVSRWCLWRPSWISDLNNFSYF